MSDTGDIAKELTIKLLEKYNASLLSRDFSASVSSVNEAAETVRNAYKIIFAAVNDAIGSA